MTNNGEGTRPGGDDRHDPEQAEFEEADRLMQEHSESMPERAAESSYVDHKYQQLTGQPRTSTKLQQSSRKVMQNY